MTTKTLRAIQAQDQSELAERHNGTDAKQVPRRQWGPAALKAELDEREWQAACRCVNECRAAFDGMRRAFDSEPVDGGGSDYGLAARVSAVGRLSALRLAVRNIPSKRRKYAPKAIDWIAQMWTLEDMAQAMNLWRRMGQRPQIADLRAVKPFLRMVLSAMADHYEGASMNELVMGVGEGWKRTNLTADDLPAIQTMEANGFQIIVTAAGAVFMRDPREESVFQPQQRNATAAA